MSKAKKKTAKVKTGIDLVTIKWIESQMLKHNLETKDLAPLCFVSVVQIHQWISGFRNMSNPSKAVLYYVLTYYPYIKGKEKK